MSRSRHVDEYIGNLGKVCDRYGPRCNTDVGPCCRQHGRSHRPKWSLLGYVSMSRKKGKSRQLQSFIGFSKVFLTATESGFIPEDDRIVRRMLGAKKVDYMEKLLMTSPDKAANLARSLSYKERCEVARHFFPLVYAHCDVITTTNRRRFRRICEQLNLNVEVYCSISKDYRQRLETQWAFVRTMIQFLNYFAVALRFDL